MTGGGASRRRIDRVAEAMADGATSLIDVAYRLRLTEAEAKAAWRTICRELGAQAR